MTASLKLKVEEREKLYYSKYTYKAVCRVHGAYYTYNVKSIDEYKEKILDFKRELRRLPVQLSRDLDDADYLDIDSLIRYTNRFEKNNKGSIRRESNSVTFFSNDLDFLKKAPSTLRPLKISQAVLLPAGIKYFKREVPAPYRVHFKETRISIELVDDIRNYVEKTSGVEASSSLNMWLHRPYRWNQVYVSKSFFINYTDPSQLTMMHILFPEVIGKNYKLEKK